MNRKEKEENIIKTCIDQIKIGKIPPWKVEDDVEEKHGIEKPDNFRIAAQIRRRFIEEKTRENFKYIHISEKPFKAQYMCRKDNIIWELDASDSQLKCSFCGAELEALDQFAPLVANYIGGTEGYYSYAGQVIVKGDLEREFTNLLQYGTGLGPIGVTRGCYVINKMGGAEVKIADKGRAARCLGYRFKSEQERRKAIEAIESYFPELKNEMNSRMSDFQGRINSVEFVNEESQKGFILYVDFVADFKDFRGHGAISHAVGFAKKKLEKKLRKRNIMPDLSVIAQGYDGDLKLSPRNKRGRYASAQIRIPLPEFEDYFDVDPEKFLSFVEIDRKGAKKLGCPYYSGMGGEIIPAVYKATRVNPHSSLVSSFQRIFAEIDKEDLIYGIELPNVEVGVASTQEGIIPPVGREALRIMGIQTAKDFAASLAAQVLAGEFNLALEISRERLYG